LGIPFTLLKEVERINGAQLERFLKKIRDTLWVLKDKRIAVWGLTFKPDTDDVRSSVAINLVNNLLQEGAIVQVYDPKGMEKAAELKLCMGANLAKSAIAATENAEALVLATEWDEFQNIDFVQVRKSMHTPIIFDGRNLFDPRTMSELGFHYFGIGRSGVH
jgi:UDPglucose 6-dehydrogenase